MNVAYIHHHLRPGGVTRVILDELESLKGRVNALVITGEPPPFPAPFPWTHLPELSYDSELKAEGSPEDLARSIAASARRAWVNDPCIFHVHNPILGKTRALVGALKILRDKGANLLLHVHDFAEDGRPELYSPEEYPSDCHYAVINRRDYAILRDSGLEGAGLHYIPDAVRPVPVSEQGTDDEGFHESFRHHGTPGSIVLYATRAIRRKNIGEAVLLSLFLPPGQRLGVTLEPTGALDRRSFDDWKGFVRDEGLQFLFGLGRAEGLGTLMAETSSMVTTSVKEGFGLSFLEPWTARKMLFGRLLEDVCRDFVERGLRLGHLYRRLRIPLKMLDMGTFERKWRRCYAERLRRYGIVPDKDMVEDFFHALRKEGCVDFGLLSEDLQRGVLRRAMRVRESRLGLVEQNPFLDGMFAAPGAGDLVEANRGIVVSEFSLEKTAARLLEAYEKVLSRQVTHSIDKEVVVSAFNAPDKNQLLLCPSAYE
jgi:hypothetical protein